MVEAVGVRVPVVGALTGGRESSQKTVQEVSADVQRHVSDRLGEAGRDVLPDSPLERLVNTPGPLDRFAEPAREPDHRPAPLR